MLIYVTDTTVQAVCGEFVSQV